MNLKTLLASLVLGSSSLAMAAPAAPVATTTIVRDHGTGAEYTTTTVVADRDRDAAPAKPNAIYYRDGQSWRGMPKPPVYRPVTLASGLRLGQAGRATIAVGSQAGRFDTLQLTASAGKAFINQVIVQFTSGPSQVVGLRRTLDGNDTLTVDLTGNHREIRRIVVTGNELASGHRRPYAAVTLTAS